MTRFLSGVALGLCGTGAWAQAYRVVPLTESISERWREPGVFAVRRDDASRAETVTLIYGGRAQRRRDYAASHVGPVTFAAGQRELFVTITPALDSAVEPAETIVLALQGKNASGTLVLYDAKAPLTDLEANRFLLQAAWGGDATTMAEVKRLGYAGWIEAQFARTKGYLQPHLTARRLAGLPNYHPETKVALWNQVMRRLPATGDPATFPDPLRQRVAYSLMQIFVISQQTDTLMLNSEGVAHYYDRMLDGAFGNFRDLLKNVCLHPTMGSYLSHVGNRKADPSINRYPDENFAREVMQLFSIGLWELNPDGTRKLMNGQPIPTYTQETIREYARVFTGFKYDHPDHQYFEWMPEYFLAPMRAWDEFHDLAPKRLLSGITTPQRAWNGATGPNDPGTAAMADLDLAVESLFRHPNVGPFMARLLIQRLVTSNPSPAYVGRVAAAFDNNGSGVRGDMRAVVRAILLDAEARDWAPTQSSAAGRKREPYLTLFQLAKTFDCYPPSMSYQDATYLYDLTRQEAFMSPSVFNFYLPDHRPSGAMTERKLNGPEFQIMTAVTANGTLNLQYQMIYDVLARWGQSDPNYQIKLNLDPYLPLANDPDALVRRIATRMLDRPLKPRVFTIVRDAVARIDMSRANAARDRARLAIYLIVSTPDYQIQK